MTLRINLITGRTINQGVTIEIRPLLIIQEATAYCELNSKDAGQIGKPGSNIKVKTAHGEVVVKLKENNGNPDGLAFIPMGPWANAVSIRIPKGVECLRFKGIPSQIESTNEKILLMKELIAEV